MPPFTGSRCDYVTGRKTVAILKTRRHFVATTRNTIAYSVTCNLYLSAQLLRLLLKFLTKNDRDFMYYIYSIHSYIYSVYIQVLLIYFSTNSAINLYLTR
jgi:hypothetical protein